MSDFQARTSQMVDASPERVLAILRDYRVDHPAILPRPPFTVMNVIEGGLGAGTVLEVGLKAFGKERRVRGVVTEPEPGHLIETYDEPKGLVTSFRVESDERGTRVTIETLGGTQSDGLFAPIEAWLTARMLQSVYRKELALLQTRAQSG